MLWIVYGKIYLGCETPPPEEEINDAWEVAVNGYVEFYLKRCEGCHQMKEKTEYRYRCSFTQTPYLNHEGKNLCYDCMQKPENYVLCSTEACTQKVSVTPGFGLNHMKCGSLAKAKAKKEKSERTEANRLMHPNKYCQGLTKTGNKCKVYMRFGGYCNRHTNQAPSL